MKLVTKWLVRVALFVLIVCVVTVITIYVMFLLDDMQLNWSVLGRVFVIVFLSFSLTILFEGVFNWFEMKLNQWLFGGSKNGGGKVVDLFPNANTIDTN